ncbi:phosphatidylglycerol lysyltransferase domain-containing protein [Embleya sp. NPDC050493]|uniref:phosphatidylglycerol lysyltransferase domain-containing protein n=1 Tax=Embleya sp. NPDC050493 TaxID=3363989 RepID=UPI00379BAECF
MTFGTEEPSSVRIDGRRGKGTGSDGRDGVLPTQGGATGESRPGATTGRAGAATEAAVPMSGEQDPIGMLRAYADHPSAFLAVNARTRHYYGSGVRGLVAFLPGERHHLQFAGPFAAPADRGPLLDEYLHALDRGPGRRKALTAVQLRSHDVPLYADRGFAVNQLGVSYGIDLSRFTLRGKPLAKVRQNVSRARREGVTVTEVADEGLPDRPTLDRIDRQWLRDKGRLVRQLSFMVGEHGGIGRTLRRTFLARHRGEVVAYITYAPAWGSRPGWLCDLSRRCPQAPVGTHELITLTALGRFTEEGAGWLHLGLAPFVGLADEHEQPCASALLGWAIRQGAKRGRELYPARTQEAFKLKWAPHVCEPEYVAFQDRVRVAAVWRLLRATRVL